MRCRQSRNERSCYIRPRDDSRPSRGTDVMASSPGRHTGAVDQEHVLQPCASMRLRCLRVVPPAKRGSRIHASFSRGRRPAARAGTRSARGSICGRFCRIRRTGRACNGRMCSRIPGGRPDAGSGCPRAVAVQRQGDVDVGPQRARDGIPCLLASQERLPGVEMFTRRRSWRSSGPCGVVRHQRSMDGRRNTGTTTPQRLCDACA